MDNAQRPRQSIIELQETNLKMKEIFDSNRDGWKLELVRMRIARSAQLSSMSEYLDEWSTGNLDKDNGAI